MRVNNILTTFAKSKCGQKIYKNILDPSKEKFWNENFPLLETSVASIFYIISTEKQKNIDKESRKAMQWQNVLSWIFSIGLSAKLNKSVVKFGENIIKGLKPELIPDAHKVLSGIRVGLPLLSVTLINRGFLPTVFTPISSYLRDRLKNKKLDVKA